MSRRRQLAPTPVIRLAGCLGLLLALTQCGDDTSSSSDCAPGEPGCSTAGAVDALGGMAGTTSAGGASSGGGAASAGQGGLAGAAGTASNTGGGGAGVDAAGVPLASPGDETTVHGEYLNLGDLRLLNNRWGSEQRGCDTGLRIYVAADRTLGWDFNRGACGGEGEQPDYPEIEFGIHPFGIGDELETSPPFSSTTLLPLQIRNIQSASVAVDNLRINLQSAESWNLNFEMWLSQRNPLTSPDPGVYAELITFWGWQDGRWPCDTSGNVDSGGQSYRLCHQSDTWADGQWRYFQFWVDGGPKSSFSGTLDVKAFLDWLVNDWGYSRDLWVTRFEVGSEIDDNTRGTVTLDDVTFEVNGTSRSVQLAAP